MLEFYNIAWIPLILGIVEVFKTVGLPRRFLPLLSLSLGILAGIFYVYPEDVRSGIIVGIVYGLSASGLYSGTKNSLEKNSCRS